MSIQTLPGLNPVRSAERVKEIMVRLENGLQDLFAGPQYAEYLKTISRFYNYSPRNTLMIYTQCPNASRVAGFGTWKNYFNRHVKKGEHSIIIYAPVFSRQMVQQVKIDPVTLHPVTDQDGKVVTEAKEVQRTDFMPVNVYDISQTEGEPLPSLGVQELVGNVENYPDFFKTLKQISPFPIEFGKTVRGAKGCCSFAEQRITLKEGMDEIQNVKTAIHEITHAKLHNYYADEEKKIPAEQRKNRRTREVEAESVAYIVCQHYGIDTSDYSFGYIATWSSDKQAKELKESLETIQETSKSLITSIDEKYLETVKGREVISEKRDNRILTDAEAPVFKMKPKQKASVLNKLKSNQVIAKQKKTADSGLSVKERGECISER